MSRAGHHSNYLLLTFPSECLLFTQTLWSVLLLPLLVVSFFLFCFVLFSFSSFLFVFCFVLFFEK